MLRLLPLLLYFLIVSLPVRGQHTLLDYVEKSVANSALIQDNKNQAAANQLEMERLKAQYKKLQVYVTANYLLAPILNNDGDHPTIDFNTNGAENYYGYDLAITNSGLYQGLINISQPLFNTKRYNAFAEQSLLAAQLNENNMRLSAHDLEKAVTDQYILCLLDKQQWQYSDSLVRLLQEQHSIVTKLSESGLLKQSDLSLITIELQTQQQAEAAFLTTYKRDLLDLNILAGIADTTFIVLPDITLEMHSDSATSYFLSKYRLDSLNLTAQQRVFELKYKPIVNAFANGGLNAVYAPTIPSRFGISGGISFAWTIFDGHQRSINERKTGFLLNSVSTYKTYFTTQNTVRKERILNEIRGVDQRLQIIQQQQDEYVRLMRLYKKELMQGQLPVINYINVLKTQTAVRRDYHLLQTNKQLLINLYNYWNW